MIFGTYGTTQKQLRASANFSKVLCLIFVLCMYKYVQTISFEVYVCITPSQKQNPKIRRFPGTKIYKGCLRLIK